MVIFANATTRGRFDWNDVIWTLIGDLIFQLIRTSTPLKHKEEKEETKYRNGSR